MGQFLVTYDLKELKNVYEYEREDFKDVFEESFILRYKKMKTTTTYLVSYSGTAEQLSNDIKSFCDKNKFSFKLILCIVKCGEKPVEDEW